MNVIIKSSYSSTPVEISQSTWTSFKCFLLFGLCSLPVATEHSHTCQPFLVHCDCESLNISESKPMLNIPPGDEKSGWGKTPDIKVTYKKLPGAQNQYGKK